MKIQLEQSGIQLTAKQGKSFVFLLGLQKPFTVKPFV